MNKEILLHDVKISDDQRSWYAKMPHVPFDPSWDVRAVPAFGGAMVRYRVQSGKADISVYMDAHDRLGSVGQPYWEIYPAANGDTDRFLLAETSELVAAIAASIEKANA